jgi:hypothetical protein
MIEANGSQFHFHFQFRSHSQFHFHFDSSFHSRSIPIPVDIRIHIPIYIPIPIHILIHIHIPSQIPFQFSIVKWLSLWHENVDYHLEYFGDCSVDHSKFQNKWIIDKFDSASNLIVG